MLLDQGSYVRPGEQDSILAKPCSEEAGKWEHLVQVMKVWDRENRSFWMADFEAQVLSTILLPKPENLKLSMNGALIHDIWCFKYKTYRPSVKSIEA